MADAGLSIPQILSVSGHKSSVVLESYVEATTAMKEVTSTALALGKVLKFNKLSTLTQQTHF